MNKKFGSLQKVEQANKLQRLVIHLRVFEKFFFPSVWKKSKEEVVESLLERSSGMQGLLLGGTPRP